MMIRTTGMIAVAALALATVGAPAASAQKKAAPQRVMAVFAHPDDELFMAPALAALARKGAQVTIYHATRGDAGPGVSDLPKGAELAKRRSAEAACAARALAATTHAMGSHGDGKLAEDPQGKDSAATKLMTFFKREFAGADLVLTWGPDGGYGHADHRMVSALATQVALAMPAAERPKLLYVGIPNGTLPPLPQMSNWATTDPALLTETIPYTPADLAAATTAAGCHETQFDAYSRDGMMTMFDATIWQGKVHFRPAF
jgi:LmbE family N-acetylglucosaminyl deacetylase